MQIASSASNSFLTYIWYHIDIPVDHDFYGLILESSRFFFRIDVACGKNSYGSVHYISLANGGAYPIHMCEMCCAQF